MRLKIFSCHHLKPEFTCNTEIFQTLVSNLPEPEDGSYMSDLGGINLAGEELYSEMRHQYYVWKNLIDRYDYIGFEHYRRPFFIDPLPAHQLVAEFPDVWRIRLYLSGFAKVGLLRTREVFAQYLEMRRSLDPAMITQVKQWLGRYDIICQRPSIENIEEQWKSCVPDEIYWNTMIDGVNSCQTFRNRPHHIFFQLELCYFSNMYIMRSELLDEYLTFCFEVLEYCRSHLVLRGRALGYFSERLFSFWLYEKRIKSPMTRVLELPFVMQMPDVVLGDPRLAGAPVL